MVVPCTLKPHRKSNSSGSSIKFQDVISVIAKFAFIVTPYPLILSMEIHCGLDQQIKMAKIFRETLGRELLLENIEGVEDGILPSPEDLKYKILLKVKPPFWRFTNNRSKTPLKVSTMHSPIRGRVTPNLEQSQIQS